MTFIILSAPCLFLAFANVNISPVSQCHSVPASAQGGSLYKFWVEATHAIWGDTELLHFHPKKDISNMKMSHFLMCKKFIKLLNTPPPWLYVNVVGFVEEKAVFLMVCPRPMSQSHMFTMYRHPPSGRCHPGSIPTLNALYMFPGHNLI